MRKTIKVLAIDGGGVRGIIPALVLSRIEELTGTPIARLFDIVAGTSAGGIIALALCADGGSGVPRHSAVSLVDLFARNASRIFRSSPWQRVFWIRRLANAKYNSEGLRQVLDEYLGEARLRDSITNLLVTSYEIEQRTPWLFRSRKAQADPSREDFLMAEVGYATAAAPTYFPPPRILRMAGGIHYAFIDGGVYANNPAMCAYVEAKAMHSRKDILLLSLGTGRLREPILHTRTRGWGLAKWARPIFGITSDSVSQIVDYQLSHLLRDEMYIRLQVDLHPNQRGSVLDDACPDTIDSLKAHAKYLIHTRRSEIVELCDRLIQP
jgi:patatin-like phospholipase/acyl hydrolase